MENNPVGRLHYLLSTLSGNLSITNSDRTVAQAWKITLGIDDSDDDKLFANLIEIRKLMQEVEYLGEQEKPERKQHFLEGFIYVKMLTDMKALGGNVQQYAGFLSDIRLNSLQSYAIYLSASNEDIEKSEIDKIASEIDELKLSISSSYLP
jgi:hypothetical protein